MKLIHRKIMKFILWYLRKYFSRYITQDNNYINSFSWTYELERDINE